MRTVFALVALVFSASPSALAANPVSPGLVGAWNLVRVETIRQDGAVIYPFYGKHPRGLIIYDPSGWMSVQIVSDPKPTVPIGKSRDAFRNAPAGEKAIAADGYYAYFGRYTVDPVASTVTHHLQDSLYPGERGEDFVRHFQVTEGCLTLVAQIQEMGELHQRRLIWKRSAASGAVTQAAVKGDCVEQ